MVPMLADIKKTAAEAFADDCAGREKILRLLLLRCGSIGVRLDESAAADKLKGRRRDDRIQLAFRR